jgi:hypothetical protein
MLVGKEHYRIVNLDTKEHIDTDAMLGDGVLLPQVLFWSVFYQSIGPPAPWAGHRLSYEAIPCVQREFTSSWKVESPQLDTIDVREKLCKHFCMRRYGFSKRN